MSRGPTLRLPRMRPGTVRRLAGGAFLVVLAAGAYAFARQSWHVGVEAAVYIVLLALLAAVAFVIALRA